MLNRTVHGYLPAFQDHLRPSVLGRTAGRTMRTLTNTRPHSDGEDDEEAPRSPATEAHMRAFFDAWRESDEDGQKVALGKVVESWRADNAAGGVPVHGHLALPARFANELARLAQNVIGSARENGLHGAIDGLDEGSQAIADAQMSAAVNNELRDSDALLQMYRRREHDDTASRFRHDLGADHNNPDEEATSPTGQRRISGHSLNSSLIELANDELGGVGSRRREANSSGLQHHRLWDTHGRTQELVLPVALGVLLRDRGWKAFKGAAYSVAADFVVTWIANARKAPGDRRWSPSAGSLVNSAITGAVSGALEYGQEHWKQEAGLAFFGAIAEDYVDGREIRWVSAIGAAVGAALYTKYGRNRMLEMFGASRWGELAARATHRVVSKVVKEVFGAEVNFLPHEAKEFVEGLVRAAVAAEKAAQYWERKIEEWSRMIDPYVPTFPLTT